MDLSRAKTVLIAAFLILNLFLLYQIWTDEARSNPLFFGQKEEVSRLESALQEANLSLDVPLPRGGVRMAHLVVTPWQPDVEEMVSALWYAVDNMEETWQQDEPAERNKDKNNVNDSSRFSLGNYELLLTADGPLSLQGPFPFLPAEQLKAAADDFIKRVSFLNDFVYDYKIATEQATAIFYRQQFEGYPLYASNLQFLYKEPGECQIIIYRLAPLGFAEQQREVIPPSMALWRFLETYVKDDKRTSAIVEFSLGYYSEEYDAQLWEIAPVWRIRLRNGEIYYINAFTGYRES